MVHSKRSIHVVYLNNPALLDTLRLTTNWLSASSLFTVPVAAYKVMILPGSKNWSELCTFRIQKFSLEGSAICKLTHLVAWNWSLFQSCQPVLYLPKPLQYCIQFLVKYHKKILSGIWVLKHTVIVSLNRRAKPIPIQACGKPVVYYKQAMVY